MGYGRPLSTGARAHHHDRLWRNMPPVCYYYVGCLALSAG